MKMTNPLFKNGIRTLALILGAAFLAAGCSFAPKYHTPAIETPAAFKELTPAQSTNTDGWKTAEPKDDALRGKWWEIFGDTNLNALEDQVDISNQTVALALQNFLSARAVVKETRSEFFPSATVGASATRQRTAASGSVGAVGGNNSPHNETFDEYSLPLDATWEPDFWGTIRNTYRANKYQAQANLADLENTRLTVQSELASDYFMLCEQDSQIRLLDSTVAAFKDSLQLTRVLHKTGIDSDQDVAQAETELYTTEAQGTDLGILRAQLEHAIAVLIGRPAPAFAVPTNPLTTKPVAIPFGVPSQLLERRPDIAAAERLVAAANAQIGVARAAYFPTVTLSASTGFQSINSAELFSGPAFIWALGGQAAETIFDAGKRRAVVEQDWATYRGTVATYRQTVLAAFQGVEDNLASLRILTVELKQQTDAVAASQRFLNLAMDRYRLGVDSYLNVITAQTTLLSNQRTALTLQLEQMTASVQLILALGGGWDGSLANSAANAATAAKTANRQ